MSGRSPVSSPSLTGSVCLGRYELIVIALMAVFAAFFSIISLFRLSVFDPQFDTVIFNQMYWNTIHHGELLTNSLEDGSHFGVHFSPILFAVLPLYYLIPAPETLFIIKSILIALGAVPVYLCARHYLGPKTGCIVALVYFFYPVVQGAAYCDYYETSFLPLFLGFALWGYLTGRENIMFCFALLCLLIKEDVSLIILMLGLSGLWMNRHRPLTENWRYLVLVLLPLIILLSFFFVIKPGFSTGNPDSANQFLNQYRDIPGNLSDQNGKRITYLLQLFAPILFLPFAAPSILGIAIPSFLELLLSPNPDYFYVGQHYSALIIPVIFMSLIVGLHRFSGKKGADPQGMVRYLPVIILILTIGSALLWSPVVPPLKYALEGKAAPTWNHAPALHRVIDAIPADIPVAAPMNILPFLTNRHDLYLEYNPNARVILLDDQLPEYAEGFQKKMGEIRAKYVLIPTSEGISLFVRGDDSALVNQITNNLKG